MSRLVFMRAAYRLSQSVMHLNVIFVSYNEASGVEHRTRLLGDPLENGKMRFGRISSDSTSVSSILCKENDRMPNMSQGESVDPLPKPLSCAENVSGKLL